jgi:HK97 family phage major capsid protein
LLEQTGTTACTAIGTNGGRFRIDNAASMAQAIDVADELVQGGNFGYIMRPEVLGGMRRERIPQFTGQPLGQGAPINPMAVLMSNEQLEQVLGYKVRTTTQLSAAIAKGTSSTCSKVIFGNWSQFYAGFWRGLEIRVSDVASDASGNSAMLKDQFYMVAFQEVDCNVGRATAFTILGDAETTETKWTEG